MQGIDQKPKAVLSRTFSGHRSGPLGGALRSVWKGSRRQSGMNIFSRYISERWRGFLQGIDQKPKAVWSQRFFGVHFRRLAGLFAGYRPKAEGCLAGIFFRGTFPKAGVAFRRGSPQSWRRPDLNVFSEHNSEGWWDFSQGIDPKSKAVWSCTFSGYRSGSLGEPRGRWEKAAGSGQALKLF